MGSLEQDLRRAFTRPVERATERGQVVADDDGTLVVVIGGTRPTVRAVGDLSLSEGDAVACLRIGTTWHVLGRITDDLIAPLVGKVVAVTAGSPTITLTAGGVEYQARFVGNGWTPEVGQDVMLTWNAGQPVAHGTIGSVPPEPDPDPEDEPAPPQDPTPPVKETGQANFTAIDSATWSSQSGTGWNPYYGRHLYQGTYNGQANRGAWFYGLKPHNTLYGRTITAARIYVPARRRSGNYNSSLTLGLYLHSSSERPSGNVALDTSEGVHNITIPAGFGGGWRDIPARFGQRVVDGGWGLAIDGSGYGGLTGVGPTSNGYNPMSGQLRLDWSR